MKAEQLQEIHQMEMWEKNNAKGNKRDKRNEAETYIRRLQNRFSHYQLDTVFSVDIEDNESSEKMKCMPSAYPHAINTIEAIYKVFS